jgi:hypothetical protein
MQYQGGQGGHGGRKSGTFSQPLAANQSPHEHCPETKDATKAWSFASAQPIPQAIVHLLVDIHTLRTF